MGLIQSRKAEEKAPEDEPNSEREEEKKVPEEESRGRKHGAKRDRQEPSLEEDEPIAKRTRRRSGIPSSSQTPNTTDNGKKPRGKTKQVQSKKKSSEEQAQEKKKKTIGTPRTKNNATNEPQTRREKTEEKEVQEKERKKRGRPSTKDTALKKSKTKAKQEAEFSWGEELNHRWWNMSRLEKLLEKRKKSLLRIKANPADFAPAVRRYIFRDFLPAEHLNVTPKALVRDVKFRMLKAKEIQARFGVIPLSLLKTVVNGEEEGKPVDIVQAFRALLARMEKGKKAIAFFSNNPDIVSCIVQFIGSSYYSIDNLQRAIPSSNASYFASYEYKILPQMSYLKAHNVVKDEKKLPSNMIEFLRNVKGATPDSKELTLEKIVETFNEYFAPGRTSDFRLSQLKENFSKVGIPYRTDSNLCRAWVNGTLVVPLGQVMAIMYLTKRMFERGHRYFSQNHLWTKSKLISTVQRNSVDWMTAARQVEAKFPDYDYFSSDDDDDFFGMFGRGRY